MRSFSFIALPKCASISTATFCKENSIPIHWHSYALTQWIRQTASRMAVDVPFCIMRDPVDRVLSAYHFLKGGGINGTDARDWRRFCGGFESFDDFVEFGLEPASREQLHFLPQWFWIDTPGQDVDLDRVRVLRFDRLSSEVKRFAEEFRLRLPGLPHKNKSARAGASVTPEQRERICEIYSRDMELLRRLAP